MTKEHPIFEAGDVISHPNFPEVERLIVDVRDTGYGWRYPDMGEVTPHGGDNYFVSENSSDPFFESGWRKVRAEELVFIDPPEMGR